MKEIQITEKEQNQRLDKFLMKYFNTAPKSFVYKMLRKKRIKYNKQKAQGGEMLQCGDVLCMYLSEETIDSFMEEKTLLPSKRHFGIVYEDNNVLVVLKPAGLLTHPEKPEDKDTLIDQILFYLFEKGEYIPNKESSFTPAVCNRLDRNTSGIVLAGKNLMAVQTLNECIASHRLEKFYLALVKGTIKKPGEVDSFLSKNTDGNQVHVSSQNTEGAKRALTKFRPLASANGYTLLEVSLITGKSHQIRVHLSSIGHAIVGDRKYGDESVNRLFKEKYGLSNQFLHAHKVIWQQEGSPLDYLKNQELSAVLPVHFQRISRELFGEIEF